MPSGPGRTAAFRSALIRSTDDGQTWCPLATLGFPVSVVPAPADDLTLWVVTATMGSSPLTHNILRSVDGGATWQDARGNLPSDVDPQSILRVGPIGGDVAWIGTSEDLSGAASTQDGGRTWARIALAPPPAPLLEIGWADGDRSRAIQSDSGGAGNS